MYCVQKKVLKANPFKKSREEISPATGRNRKFVCSCKNEEISLICGMVLRE